MGNDKFVRLIKLVMKLNQFRRSYSCRHHRRPSDADPTGIIKLVKPDGSLAIYDCPIVAADLTNEFPSHLICRSDTFYIGQKIPALSQTHRLELGHKYFVLPTQFFEHVLSFPTLASLAGGGGLRKNTAAAKSKPFHIQKTSSGSLQIRVSEEFISQLIWGESEKSKPKGKVCTTAALEKDYVQLVGRTSRQWKPKLETIKEKKVGRRKNKISISSFGIKRVGSSNKRCLNQMKSDLKKPIQKASPEGFDSCSWKRSNSKQKQAEKIK